MAVYARHRLRTLIYRFCVVTIVPIKDRKKRQAYQKRYQKTYYEKNRAARMKQINERKKAIRKWFAELKEDMCCHICGYSGKGRPWSIELDHREPCKKTEMVSYLVSCGYSKKRILAETLKCDPICANCHREKHYAEHASDPENSLWAVSGRIGRLPDMPLDGNKLHKSNRNRKRRAQIKRTRAGRDDDSVPGPNPKEK